MKNDIIKIFLACMVVFLLIFPIINSNPKQPTNNIPTNKYFDYLIVYAFQKTNGDTGTGNFVATIVHPISSLEDIKNIEKAALTNDKTLNKAIVVNFELIKSSTNNLTVAVNTNK